MAFDPLVGWEMRAIAALEADASLGEPADLAGRADLLDMLDLLLTGFGPTFEGLRRRAEALRARVEAIDAALAADLRTRIIASATPPARLRVELRGYVCASAGGGRDADDQYDSLDLLISRTLGIIAPSGQIGELPPGMVAYQPTPARWLLDLAERALISAQDTFVDIGAGLGQAAILVALLSGARAIGIEIEPAYVVVARRSAAMLGLSQVSFRTENAFDADLSVGTLFYLYTPFVGELLGQMFARLRREAASRPIRVCAYGPCLSALAAERWLEQVARCGPLHVFRSTG